MSALQLAPAERVAVLQGFEALDAYRRDICCSLLATCCELQCRQGALSVLLEVAAGRLGAARRMCDRAEQQLGAAAGGGGQQQAAGGGGQQQAAGGAADGGGAAEQQRRAPEARLRQRMPQLVAFERASLLHMALGLLLLLQFFEGLGVMHAPAGLRLQMLAHMRGMAAGPPARQPAPPAAAPAAPPGGGGAGGAAAARPARQGGGVMQRFALSYIGLAEVSPAAGQGQAVLRSCQQWLPC
jgi:hypothetical protein